MKQITLALLCVCFTYSAYSQAVYNGSDKHRFTTNYGYIDVGPFNTSYAHLYTDRPRFIVNKPFWVIGGGLSSYSASNLYLQTNGTNRMIILNSNGNVGIGTTNPAQKLEVKGKIYLNSGPDDDGIYWARHNMTMGTIPGSYNHNVVMLKPGGSSNGMLHSQLNMYIANSETSHENKVRIHTSGASFLNGGNVGIGTTNPISKLQVNGDFYLYSNESYNTGWGKTHFYWRRHSLIMGTPVGTYAHNKIELKPGGSNSGELISTISLNQALGENNHEERVQITSSKTHATYFNAGNVGIGTTTPDSKLTVKGKIHTQEVKVDLAGAVAPDYVFYKDYNLKSLEEVQNYITKEGHLPNIPSAKQMEEDGINLKEMNLKLLEKVEELTLYTLEQEKKIKELQTTNKKVLELEKKLEQVLKRKN
ncbi:hypothetical protein ABN763_13400 [Spongiivirga sp. MCCC 1A20706]|uniref:hypothetical protein n=1 Tax=Spongiivirga sp. MCCC 1A20706 TaxID=3160963 RepID=UPI0039778AA1